MLLDLWLLTTSWLFWILHLQYKRITDPPVRLLSPLFSLFCTATGTMDEVLASLQRGQIQLRKVSPPRTAPPAADLRSNLMSAIRKGVTLKKVRFWTRESTTFTHIFDSIQFRKRQSSSEMTSIIPWVRHNKIGRVVSQFRLGALCCWHLNNTCMSQAAAKGDTSTNVDTALPPILAQMCEANCFYSQRGCCVVSWIHLQLFWLMI